MTDAGTILKMIETVDPADTARWLDEIDARFLCYLTGCTFISREENIITCQKSGYTYKETLPLTTSEFTRCRSALKAMRPKGWRFAHLNPLSGFFCVADGPKQVRAPRLVGFLPMKNPPNSTPSFRLSSTSVPEHAPSFRLEKSPDLL